MSKTYLYELELSFNRNMESYQEKCEIILTGLLNNRHELEKLFQRNIDKDYLDYKEIESLLGFDLSISFLYYDSKANDKDSIFDDIAIDKTQCLIDFGNFVLTNPYFSPFLKWKIFKKTNIDGFIFDRHSYSYFIHQDKLFFFVTEFAKVFESLKNIIEPRNYQNPARLKEYLNDNCLGIENKIREEITRKNFGYIFDSEQRQKNLEQVSQTEIDEKLSVLNERRLFIKNEFSGNRFLPANKQNETKDYITDLELEKESGREVIIEKSTIVYADVLQINEKNIGGRVALADTNLEFEKLTSSNKIKFRTPESVNFIQVENSKNLFNLAQNDEIEIVSIETEN